MPLHKKETSGIGVIDKVRPDASDPRANANNQSSDVLGERPSVHLNPQHQPSTIKLALTIGMPVYNGAATIGVALASLLAQTRGDFVVQISDNASTDTTEAICRQIAAEDPRVLYYRQPKNLGPVANFRHVLQVAKSPYFMWAAADDLWAPTFVEKCINFLDQNDDYIACQSKVLFVENRRPSHLAVGTFAIAHDTAKQNVLGFLENPSDNSRYYGMFRTPVLQKSFPKAHFHALDWAVSARTLRHGKHAELPEVLMIRESSDISAYQKGVLTDHTFALFRFFPVLVMSGHLLLRGIAPLSRRSLYRLYQLNLFSHFLLSPYRSKHLAQHFFESGRLSTALLRWLRRKRASPTSTSEMGTEIGTCPTTGLAIYGSHGIEPYGDALLSWTNGHGCYVIEPSMTTNVRHAVVSLWPIAPGEGTEFSVMVNGHEILSDSVSKGDRPITFTLPLESGDNAQTIIEFLSSTFHSPGDARLLGVAIRSIKLVEADEGNP